MRDRLLIRKDVLLINSIVVMQLALYAIYVVTDNSSIQYANCVIGMLGLFYYFAGISRGKRSKIIILMLAFFLFYCSTIIMRYSTSYNNVICAFLTYIPTALLLTDKRLNPLCMLACYYAFAGFVIYKLSLIGFQLVDKYTMFAHHSINYTSFYVIIALFPYFVACFNQKIIPRILPSIICFIISLLSYGRGGIIMSGIFIAGIIMKNIMIKDEISRWKKRALILVTLASVIFVVYSYDNIFAVYFTRFSSEGMESVRTVIWGEYLVNVKKSFANIMFGYGISNSSLLTYYSGNLHNSFLMLHRYYGLFGSLASLFLLVKGMLFIWKERGFDLITIIISIMVKSFTDWNFPMQMGDIVFWYVLVFPIIYDNYYYELDNDDECVNISLS